MYFASNINIDGFILVQHMKREMYKKAATYQFKTN